MAHEASAQAAAGAGLRLNLSRLNQQFGQLNRQLSAVEKSTAGVSKAMKSALAGVSGSVKGVLTLFAFDEINRLKEAASGGGSGGSRKKSTSDAAKTKSKVWPAQVLNDGTLPDLSQPMKNWSAGFWNQFHLGIQRTGNEGEQAGRGLLGRIADGIGNALGNARQWVSDHIWSPIQSGWSGLGSLTLGLGAKLTSTAGELWSGFRSGWGTRAVEIWNSLTSTAGGLWSGFASAWGSRGVSIGNTLANAASTLWSNFQLAWGNPGIGIGNTLVNAASTLWSNFQLAWGVRGVGIGNTLVNAASTLWNNFQLGWGSRGVSIGNTLSNAASTLWNGFLGSWGSRSVSIGNTLKNAASTLWSGFTGGWGNRSVSINNVLTNSAATLWNQFRNGWSGKSLGLTVSYSTNVSGVKRAVYKALGLSGWPSIHFAARGGVFSNATLTMLGEAGTEAVVPLENNTGWMDIMAQKLGERMGGGTGTVVVPVYIGGEKLAEQVVNAVNATTRATGVSPLYM